MRTTKDLSIRSGIIKFLDGNIEKALFDIVDIGIDFDVTLKAQATEAKIKYLGLHYKHLQRSQVWLPVSIWWLINISSSSSMGSKAISMPPRISGIHVVHTHACKQNTDIHKIKNEKFYKNAFV